MPDQTPLDRAKAIALRYLAASARTEAQVRARLARAELAGEADAVVSWLLGLGYVDDAAYAATRARSLLGAGRAGPRLAETRLVAAGIAPERARAAVSAAVAGTAGSAGAEGEAALCRTLAERRARTGNLAGLDGRARARLARFLLGRGFSGSAVARVLGVYEDG
ncbi:MAG TPA: regulatory protein RecX [Anaeromyxobacter sp.]